jgi:hypothetical protein
MRWVGLIVSGGKTKNSCRCLRGKLAGKGKLRRFGSKWEYNIRMGLKEM